MGVTVDISGDAKRFLQEQAKIVKQQRDIMIGYAKMAQGAQKSGQATDAAARRNQQSLKGLEKSFGDVEKKGTGGFANIFQHATKVAGVLGIGGGIATGIQAIIQGTQTWRTNMAEIAEEVRKAGSEIIAFTALQEGGVKAERVRLAAELAREYGITERGEAFDTVQAMQSILGSFQEGMKDAETIFAAAQVGIPVQLGRELEVLGVSAGMEPGAALRKAFVAGELSGRTPEAIARAAEALPFWTDKDFMMAFAGAFAGQVPEQQIGTYMKRAGMALMPTSGLGKRPSEYEESWYEQQGLGADATQLQRFQAIADALEGMTEEQRHVFLEKAGMTEIRERQAIASVAQQLPRILKNMEEIQQLAVPGVLMRERAQVEKELPWMKHERWIRVLEAGVADETLMSPQRRRAMEVEFEERLTAMALRRLGIEQMGPFDVIEEGKTSMFWDRMQMALVTTFAPLKDIELAGGRVAEYRDLPRLLAEEKARILEEMKILKPGELKPGEWGKYMEAPGGTRVLGNLFGVGEALAPTEKMRRLDLFGGQTTPLNVPSGIIPEPAGGAGAPGEVVVELRDLLHGLKQTIEPLRRAGKGLEDAAAKQERAAEAQEDAADKQDRAAGKMMAVNTLGSPTRD